MIDERMNQSGGGLRDGVEILAFWDVRESHEGRSRMCSA